MVGKGQYQCPCCDYYTLSCRAGYEICRVCYWEDDGHDFNRLDQISGANHISLREARGNFTSMGAADQAAVSLVVSASERECIRREVRATYG